MQFQVPQFIETEDKVVGPFSLRQFAYVGVAALVSALFYFTVQVWLFVVITLVLVGGALALSFVKIEGRPLANIILSATSYYWRPQAYIWKSEHAAPQKAPQENPSGLPLEDIVSGMALHNILAESPLHKRWKHLQTGEGKTSDKQFIEKQMEDRYEIFRENAGDRNAARRVDYR